MSSDCAPVPPLIPTSASSLYRHALESIFAFFNLSDLASAIRVNHNWQLAERTMRSLETTIFADRFAKVLPSLFDSAELGLIPMNRPHRLTRHIIIIRDSQNIDRLQFTSAQMGQLSSLMPHLQQLSGSLISSRGSFAIDRVPFPSQLRKATFCLSASLSINDIHSIILALSRCLHLHTLCLRLPTLSPTIRFTALSNSFSLRDLTFLSLHDVYGYASPIVLNQPQMDDLRSLVQLNSLTLPRIDESFLMRLLRPSHQLRLTKLQSINSIELSLHASDALQTLPSLTQLEVNDASHARVDFLHHLPNLTLLHLHMPNAIFDLDVFQLALSSCSLLTDLHLNQVGGGFTSAHMCRLLPHLPHLRALHLDHLSRLNSLRCFSSHPSIGESLHHLELTYCQSIPSSEMHHLHGLKLLESLSLANSLSDVLTPSVQYQYRPFRGIFPSLYQFVYSHWHLPQTFNIESMMKSIGGGGVKARSISE